MKAKSFPLLFLSESQDLIDTLFSDSQVCDFLTGKGDFNFMPNILTIHMTDQQLYSKFDYEIKVQLGIHDKSSSKKEIPLTSVKDNF